MKCPEGQYYCFDDEKCKPIPEGKKVRKDGELVSEVAPPGYGHTKGDKERGVKRGGTAAAFDRARKEGRFKGSKSDMFAIMWSQKNKGDKPHYKPGTDKKYKKYQEEVAMPHVSSKDKNGNEIPHENLNELNRYGKETGKATGSMNKRPGSPVKKGGSGDKALNVVRGMIRKQQGKPEGQQKKVKGVKSDAGTGKYLDKQKSKKAFADRAKKAGYKNPQDYANAVARYGSEDNMKKGRGLGT